MGDKINRFSDMTICCVFEQDIHSHDGNDNIISLKWIVYQEDST